MATDKPASNWTHSIRKMLFMERSVVAQEQFLADIADAFDRLARTMKWYPHELPRSDRNRSGALRLVSGSMDDRYTRAELLKAIAYVIDPSTSNDRVEQHNFKIVRLIDDPFFEAFFSVTGVGDCRSEEEINQEIEQMAILLHAKREAEREAKSSTSS